MNVELEMGNGKNVRPRLLPMVISKGERLKHSLDTKIDRKGVRTLLTAPNW
jgi:hypothetical protein